MNKKSEKRPAAKKRAAPIENGKASNDSPAFVVGVGSSTGGTKSLKRFFANMPAGRGAAFILVQYSERQRGNLTVKLFKDKTTLAVVEAEDGMTVLADHIYIIPPDKFLSISGGKLTLQEPVLCNGLRMPIDHFFCSLAFDQRHRSIGVLLSGKGSDGTLGLSEIKAAGGRTLAEDPASAAYPGMPQSAIDAGVAGEVKPAEALAEAVIELAARLMAETRGPLGQPELEADMGSILDILRVKVGHDFRCYKPSTIIRRIKRRMSLAKITSMEFYARFLREHPQEVSLLQKDLLIGVTDFFRQPHAWETLEDKVIASIVEGAQPGSEIRVWVPGCSTGKEAYSLAMVLAEHVEKSGKKVTVQIFATDSDLASLATARSGVYSKEDFGDNVSPERLKRFFVRKDGRYQVAKNLRERVVFAPQNITADPPFSRLDLISCRNLLIYLDQEVQKKIIALFHFALREGGFLFLGTAETVGDREELFEPVSKKWRIYRRIGVGRRLGVEIPVRPTAPPLPEDYVEAARVFAKAPPVTPPSRMSLTSGAQHMLLDRFAPACVMIDRKLQVLYVHGSVEDYLTFPPGELTTRVVDMAREGLRARLRGAIAKCLQSHKSVPVTARVRRGDKSVAVKTVVSPLRYPREIDGLLLITFEDYRIPIARTSRDAAAAGDARHIEDELKITREELKSTIEQLESANDELKASNEEVTAANEELQSANEELETSKEELQSLNEELNTINVRLHEKVDELEVVNNDVVNLLSSTNIATVFLDRELKVKRYTPASTRLMSLIPTDTGRHIADILRRFSDETLLDDAGLVLADLTPLSREVQADDGRWYIRRITPYRTQDDRIEGVVITFVDVADLKEAEDALRRLNSELEQRVSDRTAELQAASLYSRSLIEASLDPLVTISPEGRITDVNEATEQVTGRTRKELIGTDFSDYFTNPHSAQAGYRKVLAEGQVRDYPLTIRHTSRNTTDVLYNATVYRNQAGEVQGVFAAARDVTELKQAEEALRTANETLEQRVANRTAELAESEARYRELVQNANSVIIRWKSDGTLTFFNEYAQTFFGYSADEVIGKHVGILLPNQESTGGDLTGLIQDIVAYPERYVNNINENVRRDGSRLWMAWTNKPILGAHGNVAEILAVGTDITERKLAEDALNESRRRLSVIVDSIADGFYALDREWRFTHVNDAALRHMGTTREEILGRTLFDVYPEARGSVIANEYESAMDSGEPRHFESPSLITGRILEIHAYPSPESLTVLFRDITEKHRMATALREAHERAEWLARFPEENPNPVMRVSADGSTLYCNPASAEIPGWVCEVGQQLTKPLLPLLGQAMTAGKEIQDDVKLGGKFYSVAVVPIPGEGYANIYGRDITERKHAEEAVSRSQKTFSELVERSPFGTYIVDSQFRIALMNAASQDGAFRNVRPVVGRDFSEAMHILWPDDVAEEIIAHFRQTLDTGEPYYSRDFINPRHDAEIVEAYEWELHRMTLPDGQYGVICYYFDSTKLREAEEALRQSEARWNAAIENFGEGAIIATEDEQVIYWNPAARAMHGFTSAEEGLGPLRKTPITFQLWTPDGQHMLELDEWPMRRIKHGETVRHLELRLRRPDQGWEKIVSYSGAMVETASGERLIFLSVYDLTELRQAEEALRESEERYRHLVKYAPTGIYDIDYATGRFVEVNDAMCLMLGYTRDEILAMTAFDILADEGKALLASRIRLGQSGEGLSEAVEYPVRTKDGRLIWALLNTMFHRIDGRIIKATVIASDITERKQAEEKLRTALQRLHALFAGMQSSLLLVGEGRIEMANQAFCDYFGLQESPGDLVGLTPRQLIDKIKDAYLHPDEQVRRIWEIARGGQPVIGEEISLRDGRTSLRDFIPIYADGKSYGLLWHHIDITKRKQAEQILRERTAELEAANKELESFSYSVSHDLRAPLRAIDGYARMLLKKHGDEFDVDSLRKFNVIRSSSQMMGQLIDDILTLSRVVKKHLSASQIEMDAVVREVWKDLETIEPERNMKLAIRDLPTAFGDRTLIKQVYANLLSNAVKFTKYRDPALIETGGYVEGNENVYYIKDNGVGFEMEYYDKLFGIFQRLHKPDEFEGTGVGLATVERIIQRHGGRAWAEGKVNEGATFYFTLPRRR